MSTISEHDHGLQIPDLLRVLVVGDNPVAGAVVTSCLKAFGIEPVLAPGGFDAVHQIVLDGHRFDLVLMDVLMPLMSGMTAIRMIRQFERNHPSNDEEDSRARLPIVAYTSRERGNDLQDFELDDILKQPFDASELAACLAHWCPRKFQSRQQHTQAP